MNLLYYDSFRKLVINSPIVLYTIFLIGIFVTLVTKTIPLVGITLNQVVWGILLLGHVIMLLPFLEFGGFIFATFLSWGLSSKLEPKYYSKGILSVKDNFMDWEEGDELAITFWNYLLDKQGDVIKKRTKKLMEKTRITVEYRSIVDPQTIIIEYENKLYELSIHRPISIKNTSLDSRLDDKKQKQLKEKVKNETLFEQSLKELEEEHTKKSKQLVSNNE